MIKRYCFMFEKNPFITKGYAGAAYSFVKEKTLGKFDKKEELLDVLK